MLRMTMWSAIALAAIAAIGCGGRTEKIVPVSGTVFVDGEPMKAGVDGFITLAPPSGRPAIGKIDGSTGRFTLTTYEEGDGAVVGTHEVSVTVNAIGRGGNPASLIPEKYQDLSTSGLTAKVDGPTDSLKIELEGPLKTNVKSYDPRALGDDPGF
ncbi:hypothetical protein LOC68_13770 [Blastopirellula sp. JC732]|uniref:Carboxypeptidase regulatory-like domain-containing protein n=1 Tax=Blastopirellula sediminis TaxID=2894196 RepID=A0A9X1MLW5_9BACT|nr:hypothetical protein [Blastopirellula sediminis]MCC9607244.1 hypothetical protein [Blastopirellula sediminis]MCC9629463.1 hypothetical protein [Blastopirellula sediminis]